MDLYWLDIKLGYEHVMDINGLDHFYFLIALTIPFQYRDWKKLLLWVSLFTLGHSLALFFSYFEWMKISSDIIEFLIPVTISLTCLSVLINKNHKSSLKILVNLVTLFFGLIHGFGFGFYFLQIISKEDAIVALLNFAIGIEIAQLLTVLMIIILNYIIVKFLKFNARKWEIIISGIILFQALRMSFANFPLSI